jgi:hypothetical protein
MVLARLGASSVSHLPIGIQLEYDTFMRNSVNLALALVGVIGLGMLLAILLTNKEEVLCPVCGGKLITDKGSIVCASCGVRLHSEES